MIPEKDKPKRKAAPTTSLLTPEDSSSFLYVIPAPLEDVITALTRLEVVKDDLKHTMDITPVSLGYTFRYEIITPSIIKSRLSAYAEGLVTQHETDDTLIEGTIHIATSNQEILLITAMSLIPIPFLLLLPIALFHVLTQRADARLIKRNLDQIAKTFQDASITTP